MAVENEAAELQFLHKVKSIQPPEWLTPSPSRSELVKAGAQQIFSILKPYAPKSPFDKLLVDGFDAEQIWQQIDLQSQPVLGLLRREVKRYERNPDELVKLFGDGRTGEKVLMDDSDEDMRELEDDDEEEEDEEDVEEKEGKGVESETGSEEDNDEEEEKEEEVEVGKKGGIEDRFLKVDELEEYLEKDEEREYGTGALEKKKSKKGKSKDDTTEDEEDEDEDEDEIDLFEGGAGEDGDEDVMYDDFFGLKKKKEVKRKFDLIDGSEDSATDEGEDEEGDDEEEEGHDESEEEKEADGMENKKLTTFQKEKLKHQAQKDEMEKRLLEPKTWALRGEVTAAQRPKNSALEVDLDFDHNVQPPPVITEEVTVSIEEMIKKRILEGRFDDVQKPAGLPTKAPRERKELDETKSKKGLGEIYEDEYVQKTNPDAAPITFSDELKKEASMIFKKLCVKLDALSHFHFAPKPFIEDMSIQTNLPALAMEEVAPVAVSDAAMLAPEEVYEGKGDFKEETELTQAERKRRRANKKRKFKAVAAKHAPKRAKENDTVSNHDDNEA